MSNPLLPVSAKLAPMNLKLKLFITLACLVGLFVTGCGGADGVDRPMEAESYAIKDYRLTWEERATSPVAKYLMQYVAITQVDILKENSGQDGYYNYFYRFVFSNGCLQNTAYDIAGGRIQGEFWGLFSGGEIQGRVPTAAADAYVDAKNPNVIIIQSGHAQSRDLRFEGVADGSDHLTPVDQQTKNVLATYGCLTNFPGAYAIVKARTGGTSDFIIRTQGDQARPAREDP